MRKNISEGKVIDVSHVSIRYLGDLLKTSHVIIKTDLGGRYYHSHFTGKEIETERGYIICFRSHSWIWALLEPKICAFFSFNVF